MMRNLMRWHNTSETARPSRKVVTDQQQLVVVWTPWTTEKASIFQLPDATQHSLVLDLTWI